MDQKTAEAQLYRKLFSIDKECFKICVNEPQNRLSQTEETCLRFCTEKLLSCFDHMHKLSQEQKNDQ